MKSPIKIIALVSALSVCGLQQASAQVTAVNIGTALPPATLGGYTMNPFDPGSIAGASYYAHETGGNYDGGGTGGWATWGQDYTGNVYAYLSPEGATSSGTLTLSLSGGVSAVDFYMEPNQFLNFLMTATDSSGASVSTTINGYYGSSAVGFYEDTAGSYLSSISVTCTDPTGFAIGEFAINAGTLAGSIGVPDAGCTFALMVLGLAGLSVYSRRPCLA